MHTLLAATDKDRWNARYLSQFASAPPPHTWLLENQALLPPPGLAFDTAMGQGASGGWLAERGWRAAGADISEVAVRRAKSCWPGLLAFVADLNHFVLPDGAFDLILDFYYLDRALWPQLRRALRPGGLFIMETFVYAPGMNPAYLLEPGELRTAFADWEVLAYQEGDVASVVARRPSQMLTIH